MVSMNFAPGFLIGFNINGILAWQTKIYATFCIYDFYAGSDGSLQLLEMERKKKQTETIMKMNREELSLRFLER